MNSNVIFQFSCASSNRNYLLNTRALYSSTTKPNNNNFINYIFLLFLLVRAINYILYMGRACELNKTVSLTFIIYFKVICSLSCESLKRISFFKVFNNFSSFLKVYGVQLKTKGNEMSYTLRTKPILYTL